MNQSLHAICHTQRVKTIVTCAVVGGALCVACAAVTLADESFEPSTVERAAVNSTLPFLPDGSSAPPTRLRSLQHPLDRSSTTVDSPARWADLSRPDARQQPTATPAAVDLPRFDFDRPWTAPPNNTAKVHIGPAPSAFTSETFRGARHVAAAAVPPPLRPSRLPLTGYFDETSTSTRIASGPNDSRLPLNLKNQ